MSFSMDARRPGRLRKVILSYSSSRHNYTVVFVGGDKQPLREEKEFDPSEIAYTYMTYAAY